MAAAKLMDAIAGMPGNSGAYSQVSLALASKLLGKDVVTNTWIVCGHTGGLSPGLV